MLSGFPGSKPVKSFAEAVGEVQFNRKILAVVRIGSKKVGLEELLPGRTSSKEYLRICLAESSLTIRDFLSCEI